MRVANRLATKPEGHWTAVAWPVRQGICLGWGCLAASHRQRSMGLPNAGRVPVVFHDGEALETRPWRVAWVKVRGRLLTGGPVARVPNPKRMRGLARFRDLLEGTVFGPSSAVHFGVAPCHSQRLQIGRRRSAALSGRSTATPSTCLSLFVLRSVDSGSRESINLLKSCFCAQVLVAPSAEL